MVDDVGIGGLNGRATSWGCGVKEIGKGRGRALSVGDAGSGSQGFGVCTCGVRERDTRKIAIRLRALSLGNAKTMHSETQRISPVIISPLALSVSLNICLINIFPLLTIIASGVCLRLFLVIRVLLTPLHLILVLILLLWLLDGMHRSNRGSSCSSSSNRCRWLARLSAYIVVVKLNTLGGRLKLLQGRVEALRILLKLDDKRANDQNLVPQTRMADDETSNKTSTRVDYHPYTDRNLAHKSIIPGHCCEEILISPLSHAYFLRPTTSQRRLSVYLVFGLGLEKRLDPPHGGLGLAARPTSRC